VGGGVGGRGGGGVVVCGKGGVGGGGILTLRTEFYRKKGGSNFYSFTEPADR